MAAPTTEEKKLALEANLVKEVRSMTSEPEGAASDSTVVMDVPKAMDKPFTPELGETMLGLTTPPVVTPAMAAVPAVVEMVPTRTLAEGGHHRNSGRRRRP